MDMGLPKRRFTKGSVVRATTLFGVYILWDGDEIIFVDKVELHEQGGIRAKLEGHLAGEYGDETARATHFHEEYSAYPAARRVMLLKDYHDKHGRHPRCNVERELG